MDAIDKKLLEDAAEAFGIAIDRWHEDANGVPVIIYANDRGGHSFWQPLLENTLTDCMGDALRLAVKLRIDLRMDGPCVQSPTVEAMVNTGAETQPFAIEALDTGDPYAATRRSIVRAAAAIGSEMG